MDHSNIKRVSELTTKIFTSVEGAISNLKDGERITIKDLVQLVGLATASDPAAIVDLVKFYLHNVDSVYLAVGKNGGVVKGSKPAKESKSSAAA